MRKLTHYLLALTIAFFAGVVAFALWYSTPVKTQIDFSALSDIQTNSQDNPKITSDEILLSETENAYNPIPSPDGSLIAYVRTGWNGHRGSGGTGRSNLVSDIAVMDADGNVQTKQSLADAFLYGWTSDGKSLNCYRDGGFSVISLDGKVLTKGRLPADSDFQDVSERAAFLPITNSVLWLQNYSVNVKRTYTSPGAWRTESDFVRSAIQSSNGEIAKNNSQLNTYALLIPSPNGRYLAVAPPNSQGGWDKHLLIYDKQKTSWSNLGEIIIHPDEDWDYIKPAWNPWFADSSRLVFATASGIVISSPDGESKQIISNPKQASGLAVPSPDGNFVAYTTFEPTPRKQRVDLKFWGDATIWVVPVVADSKARSVTQKNLDTTRSLRWLNNHQLVFDRIADEDFYRKARLWKVDILR